MKPSKKLIEEIISNNDFSLEIAKALKVSQYAVITRAKRASKLLLLANCMKVYKEFGFNEADLYEENESGNRINSVQRA